MLREKQCHRQIAGVCSCYYILFNISVIYFYVICFAFTRFSVLLKKVGFFSFIFRLRYLYNVTFNEFISNNKVYVFSSSVQQMS